MTYPHEFICGWSQTENHGLQPFTSPAPHRALQGVLVDLADAVAEVRGDHRLISVKCPLDVKHEQQIVLPEPLRQLPESAQIVICRIAKIGAVQLAETILRLKSAQPHLERVADVYIEATRLRATDLNGHIPHIDFRVGDRNSEEGACRNLDIDFSPARDGMIVITDYHAGAEFNEWFAWKLRTMFTEALATQLTRQLKAEANR